MANMARVCSHQAKQALQVYLFLDMQTEIGNCEFLHGLSLFLKGNEGEQRHIKNNESS